MLEDAKGLLAIVATGIAAIVVAGGFVRIFPETRSTVLTVTAVGILALVILGAKLGP
jgi:hypothetical protein